jgi:uncharacterized protein (TIGR02145 family)
MTQNLDLNLDSNTTYTNEDTDLGYNPRTDEYTTASWTPSHSTYTEYGVWNSSYYEPESYDPGDLYWDRQQYTSETGIQQYHLGNYYNWAAAVAMNDSSDIELTGGESMVVEQSICPAGWTLPTSDYSDDGFDILWYNYSNDFEDTSMLSASPLYFPISGWYDGESRDINTYGWFWASTIYESGYVGSGYFYHYNDGDGVYSTASNYGLSVRCMVRSAIVQNFEDA